MPNFMLSWMHLLVVFNCLALLLAGCSEGTAGTAAAPSTGQNVAPATPEAPAGGPTLEADTWPELPGLASFDHDVRLLSYDLPALRLSPGSAVEVTLIWQTQPGAAPYTIFLHLVDSSNTLVAQADLPLADTICPQARQFSAGLAATCAALPLPDSLAEGQYQLAVGVYDAASGRRFTTAEGEDQFSLTTIEVDTQADTLATASALLPPCPVTVPNGSTPPGEQPSPGQHGTGQLWTGLWPEGKVIFEPGGPGSINADGSLGMKWWWWRGVAGQLTIEGRRLDASAPPLRADIPEGYGESGFQAAGLIFPTEGCWEVTGRVGEAELTFVTMVIKVEDSQ